MRQPWGVVLRGKCQRHINSRSASKGQSFVHGLGQKNTAYNQMEANCIIPAITEHFNIQASDLKNMTQLEAALITIKLELIYIWITSLAGKRKKNKLLCLKPEPLKSQTNASLSNLQKGQAAPRFNYLMLFLRDNIVSLLSKWPQLSIGREQA